ncbi:hypothetical protein ANN_22609 [Periplaneta americana]|uniref:Transposase n=1 Tax=Periplaneta americana TaxID=6978 RepID=A0ABQ8S8L9_PERAM|nr:hypothetical protein ANN_22609 [Periplaneta americana]
MAGLCEGGNEPLGSLKARVGKEPRRKFLELRRSMETRAELNLVTESQQMSCWILTQDFLINELPALLENVPCQQRLELWFMHDGAPAHFLRNVREHLTIFQDHGNSRGSPTVWPARSSNLNSLNFWLWGHMKEPGQLRHPVRE